MGGVQKELEKRYDMPFLEGKACMYTILKKMAKLVDLILLTHENGYRDLNEFYESIRKGIDYYKARRIDE